MFRDQVGAFSVVSGGCEPRHWPSPGHRVVEVRAVGRRLLPSTVGWIAI
jgi:hypothetical protein